MTSKQVSCAMRAVPSSCAVLAAVAMDASANSTARAEESLSMEALAAPATDPTGAEGVTLDKWTAGPTFGLVNIQPVLSCQLGKGRSLSVGNSAFVYDTENSRWSSVMLGMNYGFIVGWKGQKWRPNFEVNYDFKDDHGNQEWVLRAGVALLVPRT